MIDRETLIAKILGVEERIERWREKDRARKAEAEGNRERLWAEAVEREKLLAQAVGGEEARERPAEVAAEQRAIFVVHSEEAGRTLEGFAREGLALTGVVAGRGVDGMSDLGGS